MVPGRNRPSLDKPGPELRAFDVGVLGDFGFGGGVAAVAPAVANTSAPGGAPQEEQKRSSPESTVPQYSHFATNCLSSVSQCQLSTLPWSSEVDHTATHYEAQPPPTGDRLGDL